jgi:hypothetical protein
MAKPRVLVLSTSALFARVNQSAAALADFDQKFHPVYALAWNLSKLLDGDVAGTLADWPQSETTVNVFAALMTAFQPVVAKANTDGRVHFRSGGDHPYAEVLQAALQHFMPADEAESCAEQFTELVPSMQDVVDALAAEHPDMQCIG